MKPCRVCAVEKDLSEFNKNKGTRDGHLNICRECQRVQKKMYYTKNRDKYNAQNAEWKRKNRDRLREYNKAYYAKNGNAARRAWQAANPERVAARNKQRRVLEKCGVPMRHYVEDVEGCYWCGSSEVEHKDHVVPVGLYGPTAGYNLVDSCQPCNNAKCGKHPLRFIAEQF